MIAKSQSNDHSNNFQNHSNKQIHFVQSKLNIKHSAEQNTDKITPNFVNIWEFAKSKAIETFLRVIYFFDEIWCLYDRILFSEKFR